MAKKIIYEIVPSKQMMLKMISAEFNIKKLYWYETIYYYMIDSKLRTSVRLSSFLSDQLKTPSKKIVELAESLRDDKDIDKTMINILKWVIDNCRYRTDSANFGKVEYWATAEETIDRLYSDCDDQNSLIYILAILAGVPSYVLFCSIGNVNINNKPGGHFYLNYYSYKCNKVVAIDGTYYPSKLSIARRPEFELNDSSYQEIWFLFNKDGIWKYKEIEGDINAE